MASTLERWQRPYYVPGGGDAFLFFTVFGSFGNLLREFRLSRSRYRSNGVPEGIDLWGCNRPADAAYLDSYLEGPAARRLEEGSPELFAAVRSVPAGIVVRGSIPDPDSLAYLRDVVGVLAYLLDNGGVAVLDLLTLEWWDPKRWRESVFDLNAPVPSHHTAILMTQEDGPGQRIWFHTRGLRKFGRPDLSVRHVRPEDHDAVLDLLNRLIRLQALGGIISDGEEIRMADLPAGIMGHHSGDMEDPDFNNVHVEIRWPEA